MSSMNNVMMREDLFTGTETIVTTRASAAMVVDNAPDCLES